jgi:hypothetical protein
MYDKSEKIVIQICWAPQNNELFFCSSKLFREQVFVVNYVCATFYVLTQSENFKVGLFFY